VAAVRSIAIEGRRVGFHELVGSPQVRNGTRKQAKKSTERQRRN
jgi:hypothetical protein